MGSRPYDLWWGSLLRATTVLHRGLHAVSGGRLGRHFIGGQQIVWVTTLGRRSGHYRRVPLIAVREDGDPAKDWVVTGSNAGQADLPGWVHNARAHDVGTIELDGRTTPVRFVEVAEPDRSRLYAQLEETWSAYGMYAQHAGRQIPVFRLVPLR